MKNRMYVALISVMALTVFVVKAQQQSNKENVNAKGSMSHEEMNKRGDHVMGFDHTKTTHHFRLSPQGGAIEITANSADDTESSRQFQRSDANPRTDSSRRSGNAETKK